jgi:hypothetical protein
MQCTADEIDKLFDDGALRRIGMGSRRACYRLPGDGALCLKCYRSDDEILMGKDPDAENSRPLSPGAVKEIRSFRHDRNKNTCCQEFRYWKSLKGKAPAELVETFPKTMEIIHSPSRGWCLIEELILNDDGSAIMKFLPALKLSDANDRKTLVELFDAFEKSLVEHSIRFFDPQTIMVQRTDNGLKLRIPDFEPATRTLLPVEKLLPFLTKLKIKRRFARYRKTWEQLV